eukprot:9486656-Pyramimonas_sp.AAC.1
MGPTIAADTYPLQEMRETSLETDVIQLLETEMGYSQEKCEGCVGWAWRRLPPYLHAHCVLRA